MVRFYVNALPNVFSMGFHIREIMAKSISAVYKQRKDGRWDAFIEQYHNISVSCACTLSEARVYIDILAKEELGEFKLVKETLHYV